LFELMEVLGRERVLRRLQHAKGMAEEGLRDRTAR
jgi:hypothetical protein